MRRILLSCALALIAPPVAGLTAAGRPCVQTEFKTEMVKAACAKGGQDEAKKEMIAFVSKNYDKGQKVTKKLFTCNACHEKLDPDFERKATAYDLYKQLGGK